MKRLHNCGVVALLTASEAPAETIRSDRRVRGKLNHHDRARAADGLRDGGAVQVGDPGRGDVVAIVDIDEVEIRLGYKQQPSFSACCWPNVHSQLRESGGDAHCQN